MKLVVKGLQTEIDRIRLRRTKYKCSSYSLGLLDAYLNIITMLNRILQDKYEGD